MDATRSILPVKRGAEFGAMTVFKPNGRGWIIRDGIAIQRATIILDHIEGLNLVHENVAYVLGIVSSQSSLGQCVSDQQQQIGQSVKQGDEEEHERRQKLETEEHDMNLEHNDASGTKEPETPHEPTEKERMELELTRCSQRACCEICVLAKSPHRHHNRQQLDGEVPVQHHDAWKDALVQVKEQTLQCKDNWEHSEQRWWRTTRRMFAQTTGRKPWWYDIVLGFPTVSKPRATDERTRWEDYDKELV